MNCYGLYDFEMSDYTNNCFSDSTNKIIKFSEIKGLKIVFNNVRSIVQHFDEVKAFIIDNKIDIFCCCETWIQNKHFESEFKINNYNFNKCDRIGRRGGGVAIYTKLSDKIKYQFVASQNENNYQLIHIKVTQFESKSFDIICVYRPPNTQKESDLKKKKFFEYIELIENNDIIIGGDFNVHSEKKSEKEWFKYMSDIGLKQMITSDTRITDSSSSCIDHIYVRYPEKFNNYGVISSEISDHMPVFISRKCAKYDCNEIIEIKYNDWKRFDKTGFESSIKDLSNEIKSIKDIDKCVNKFNSKIKESIKTFLPKKQIKVKNNKTLPYITRYLRSLMNERNRVKNHFNKLKRKDIINNDLFEKYKQLRNKININIKQMKRKWFENRVEENKNDSKKMWKTISENISTKKSKRTQNIINDFDVNAMNDHFIQTPEKLVKNFGDNFHFEVMTPICENSFSLPEASEQDISDIISKLDENKAVGCDGISAKLLIRFSILVPLITFLINKTFIDLKVPEVWKTSSIKALHKSGPKNFLTNYRPISILPTISKIMEKIIYNKLYKFLTDNNLLSSAQFGFRSGHSCTDALLIMLNEIFIQKNRRKKVCVLTLDITKAFDTVCHQILIYKLFRLGLDWNSILWFTSYLENRKQFVKEKEKISETKEFTVSVPQGSLLGPLLFSIYVNDLSKLELNGQLVFYADDCSIVYSADDYQELESLVNSSLNEINNWMFDNRLTINEKKSNYLLIDFSGRHPTNLSLKIGENELQRVYETKVLGITVDDRLSFKSHINNLCTKLSARIGLISRLRQFLPKKILNVIFKAIVQPNFDYGINIYGFTFQSHINKIQKLLNRAARVISSSDKDIKVLYEELNWKSFIDRRKYFCSIFIYKCLNNLGPELCQNLFHYKVSEIRTKSIINSELFLPKKFSETFGNSIFYTGVQIYNSLDKKIRLISNFKKFINFIRKL